VPQRKRAITLSLDYRFLRDTSDAADLIRKQKKEIRDRIWEYYRERTIQNLLNTHPLMRKLSARDRNDLFDAADFFPAEYEEPIQLEIEDVWQSWILVASGGVTLYDEEDDSVELHRDDCLGAIRLVVGESPPYSKITVSSRSHLVSFPWQMVKKIIDTDESFEAAVAVEGVKIRRRLEGKRVG
jgi:hypothetical protein